MIWSSNPKQAIIRVAAYAACVAISYNYCGGYWVVGPVFGLTVAIFDLTSPNKFVPKKHVLFIALSTWMYALVYRISLFNTGDDSALSNYFIGSFPIAIITGSGLLPLIHQNIFNRSRAGMTHAILSLIGSFYLIQLLMMTGEKLHWNPHFPWMLLLIAVWQGMYLFVFFGEKPSGLRDFRGDKA